MHAGLAYSTAEAEEVIALSLHYTAEEGRGEKFKQLSSALSRRNVTAAVSSLPLEVREHHPSIATALQLLFHVCRWKEEQLITPLAKPKETVGGNGTRVLRFEYRFAIHRREEG